MNKTQRLIQLMMAVNERMAFTTKELAQEFGVSERTMHRDLQELSELGMPLYTEFGPHGGYRLLKKRMLPPILFTEQEAVAMFFAFQSLQYYGALPFAAESTSALGKFYHYLPTIRRSELMHSRIACHFGHLPAHKVLLIWSNFWRLRSMVFPFILPMLPKMVQRNVPYSPSAFTHRMAIGIFHLIVFKKIASSYFAQIACKA
ncbi:hypothetical protein PAENIP36_29430 [Paenibacillus sp. P36]